VYVPELVLGHLLTGSNFDDSEDRLTGGTYGYGAKLTNIFSTSFELETVDARARKRYVQRWSSNMGEVSPPDISPVPVGTKPYTRVTFSPDLTRFGVTNGKIPPGTLAVMQRRVVDVAGAIHLVTASHNPVTVKLNNRAIPVHSFEDYVRLFPGALDDGSAHNEDDGAAAAAAAGSSHVVVTRVNRNLEIGVAPSDPGTASPATASVSFVNGVATPLGGTHVAEVTDLLTKRLVTLLSRRHPDLTIRPALVRNHLRVFVNCLVSNPAFDSQSKERLTTPVANLGFNIRVTEAFAKQVADAGVEAAVVEAIQQKEKAVRVAVTPWFRSKNQSGSL